MAVLRIIRGLPGTGKSTYAKTFNCFHVEADMFFMTNGKYVFNPEKIKDAHEWCKQAVRTAMMMGMDVVVSNTFTMRWEIQPYLDLAEDMSYEVHVYQMNIEYGNNHDVPQETIEKMRHRWEEVKDIPE